jgi:hypothetical protein
VGFRSIPVIICVFLSSPAFSSSVSNFEALPIKSEVEQTAIQYFIDNANPDTGLVLDRSENFIDNPATNNVASLAATGFGLAVISNAAMRGLIPHANAEEYALKTLRFIQSHVARRKGWFLHFVDWSTGERMWNCEYSTIDSALFIAGAMYAARIFSDNSEIERIVQGMYLDMDFQDMLTDGGERPDKKTLSMAYTDGIGYTRAQWDSYSEEKLLLILGLGHPTHPLDPSTWLAWSRAVSSLPDSSRIMGLGGALFEHQYSELFVDFRGFQDGFANYFQNSSRVTAYQRQLSREDRNFRTLREGFWGFSAGEDPDGYRVWSALYYRGTVCIGCVAGSVMYMPETILQDLSSWRSGPYGHLVWGRYGFIDSLNLDRAWFAPVVLGITKGPEYLSLANIEPRTSLWKDFMSIPAIQRGLARAASAAQFGGNLTRAVAQD